MGNMKRLLTTGVSRWNTRQIALWDQVCKLTLSNTTSPPTRLIHTVGRYVSRPLIGLCVSPQEDLSMPIVEEEIDGLSGLLFPFYDPDTHMLYLAGKVNKLAHLKSTFECRCLGSRALLALHIFAFKASHLCLQGDGNIRYYEITSEKPYLVYLMEFRSPAPQKGLGMSHTDKCALDDR